MVRDGGMAIKKTKTKHQPKDLPLACAAGRANNRLSVNNAAKHALTGGTRWGRITPYE